MVNLDVRALKRACRSDVSQTYRLWELWSKGKLKFPSFASINDMGPGHHEPLLCPHCHSVNSLEFLEQDDYEEMSEGQASDYLAGMWGISICTVCNHEIEWEA